jgi:hypothetical protein
MATYWSEMGRRDIQKNLRTCHVSKSGLLPLGLRNGHECFDGLAELKCSH